MSLYPRYTVARLRYTAAHARARAHIILDRAIAGHDVDEDQITWALRITGDIE